MKQTIATPKNDSHQTINNCESALKYDEINIIPANTKLPIAANLAINLGFTILLLKISSLYIFSQNIY